MQVNDVYRKDLLKLDKLHWSFHTTFACLWLLLAVNASLFPLITRSVQTSMAMAALSFIVLFLLIGYHAWMYFRWLR